MKNLLLILFVFAVVGCSDSEYRQKISGEYKDIIDDHGQHNLYLKENGEFLFHLSCIDSLYTGDWDCFTDAIIPYIELESYDITLGQASFNNDSTLSFYNHYKLDCGQTLDSEFIKYK